MSHTVETQPRFIAPEISPPVASDASGALINAETVTAPRARKVSDANDSLFNRFAWLYVFFREKLFRDDTQRMIDALWAGGRPRAGTTMIELGCGPGFYSCGFAARFPELSVLGVDRAPRQLDCAKSKARRLRLTNCRFESDNVLDLSHLDESFHIVIAARLFTVLPDQERALSEMHRILKPGGRCLVAEPRYRIWASLPLLAMWLVARATGMNNGCCEPTRATVLSPAEFRDLFSSQPWRNVKVWQDGRYQYALCEKV